MISTIPVWMEKVSPENIDKEILRTALIAELDAINLYEQMADKTDSEIIKKVLLDIAKEEKTHVGELGKLLVNFDAEQTEELEEGAEEVEEILSEYPY